MGNSLFEIINDIGRE